MHHSFTSGSGYYFFQSPFQSELKHRVKTEVNNHKDYNSSEEVFLLLQNHHMGVLVAFHF